MFHGVSQSHGVKSEDTNLRESPVPFMAADGRRDEAWLLITETRLAASVEGGLVLTMTVPPAPAAEGGDNLPTDFRL
jgi:hypothetical protein